MNRSTTKWLSTVLATGLLTGITALLSPLAFGQAKDFAGKPIKIIVPFAAGSGADSNSRFYGELLAKSLGTTVVVENRPGGSGVVAVQAVRAAPADGFTILQASNSPMVVNSITMKELPYDSVKDFRPIHGLSKGPVAFIVRADAPYKTMRDLIDATKKENKPLTVGNYSAGYQLVAAWLGTAGGVQINHVPYKGGAQMMTDIIGGQLVIGAIDFSGAVPLIKDGKLRAIALTAGERNPGFPDVPTMKDAGFSDFETYVWSSFYIRAETPDDVTDKLVEAMKKVMVSAEAKTYQAAQPTPPMMFGPAEMKAFLQSELARFKKVAQAAGIQPQ